MARSAPNCNRDVEIQNGACDPLDPAAPCSVGQSVGVGDACDPNPCAYTRVGVRSASLPIAGIPSTERYLVPDRIQINGVVGGPGVRATTGFRFCACQRMDGQEVDGSLRARQACRAVASGGCEVADTPARARSLFDTTDIPVNPTPPLWRHPSLGIVFGGGSRYHTVPLPLEPALLPVSFVGQDGMFDWQLWQTDVPRWTGPYGDIIEATAPALPGVLWTHSARDIGASGDSLTRELRSHYLSGPLAPQFFLSLPTAGSLPFPVPDCVGRQVPCLGVPTWMEPHTLSAFVGRLGAIPAAAAFPSEPAFLASDLAWVPLAEPVELLRRDQTLRYVSVSLDGERIVDALHHTALGYTPPGFGSGCPGGPNCPPPPCENPNQCFASGSLRLASTADPSPRFVLSASRGELFVVARGVTVVRPDDGTRRALDLAGETLGETLAATYDALSDRLFVIDEQTAPRGRGRRRQARLIAIDPDDGGAIVLATWPHITSTVHFALGAAQDGALYLAASGDRGPHVLVSITVEHHAAWRRRPAYDEVIARGVGVGAGVLASEVVYASRFEVSFAVERSGHLEVVQYMPEERRVRAGDCMADVF